MGYICGDNIGTGGRGKGIELLKQVVAQLDMCFRKTNECPGQCGLAS